MTDCLKGLIEIPGRVSSGDLILNLSSGLQDSAIKLTLRDQQGWVAMMLPKSRAAQA